MSKGPLGCAFLCLWAVGCQDQVVGAFSSGGSGGTTESIETTGTQGPSASTGTSSPSTGEDGPFVGCFADEFDDQVIDPGLWNPFVDAGATVEESGGSLLLIPAATGLAYSGVTLGFPYRYRLEDGWVRANLAASLGADQPINVYLRVGDDEGPNYTLRVGGSTLSVTAPDETGENVASDFPEFGSAVGLGIRGANGNVTFEISLDGTSWQTVATRPVADPVERTKILLMAETVGDANGAQPVAVERIEACAE